MHPLSDKIALLVELFATSDSFADLSVAWKEWTAIVGATPEDFEILYERVQRTGSREDSRAFFDGLAAPRKEADGALHTALAAGRLNRPLFISVLQATSPEADGYEAANLLVQIFQSCATSPARSLVLRALGQLANPWGACHLVGLVKSGPTYLRLEAARTLRLLAGEDGGDGAIKRRPDLARGGLADEGIPVLRSELASLKVLTQPRLAAALSAALIALEKADHRAASLPLPSVGSGTMAKSLPRISTAGTGASGADHPIPSQDDLL